MTDRDCWQSAAWLLRRQLGQLAELSPLADLKSYRQTLWTMRAIVASAGGAPAHVVELIEQMEFTLREREIIKSRATSVLSKG